MQPLKNKSKRSPLTATKRSIATHKPNPVKKQRNHKKRLVQPAHSSFQRQFSTTTTTPPTSQSTTTTTPQQVQNSVLYDAPLNKKERLLSIGLVGLGTFTTLQVASGLIYSPDSSIIIPALITAGTVALGAYVRRAMKNRCTRIVAQGPEDPIQVSTPGIFGQNVTHRIDRRNFQGIPRYVDSRAFFDPKRPFLLVVKDRKHPFLLDRKGLFDTSGPLNTLLGYDIVTFERCAPSPAFQQRPKQPPASKQSPEAAKQQQRDV